MPGAALVFEAFDRVTRAIDSWKPPALRKESDYEKHLANHLARILGDAARIKRRYHTKNSELDIAVEFRWLAQDILAGIELKRNLSRKADLQKLRGQILEYAEVTHALFVVLCGETDETMVPLIDQTLKEAEKSFFRGDPIVRWSRVVVK